MAHKDDSDDFQDMTNKEMLTILMQEIADVRHELKNDIAKLDARIGSLNTRVESISTEVKGLRTELHQNQSTFINAQEDLDKRVSTLEAVA
mgnify:CR=1 FL=1